MVNLGDEPIRNGDDVERFETELKLEQRLPERSILDVFVASAARQPDATAMTMLMTGAPDEQPRRVSYAQLLGLIRRAANMFSSLGGPAPGVAYMLPSCWYPLMIKIRVIFYSLKLLVYQFTKQSYNSVKVMSG